MLIMLLEITIILLLIALNGVLSMSELALASVRHARLAVLERQKMPGASAARQLAADPQLFLPTLQFGITLVGVLEGVFGGARIAARVAQGLAHFTLLAPVADELALALVVVLITFLTLVLGELVPKQLALRRPELIAIRVARPIAVLAKVAAPVVWLLRMSSSLVLRLAGQSRARREGVTEEELKALLVEGTKSGVLETEEREMIERVLRLADKPVRAMMTPRNEVAWIDRTAPRRAIAATLKEAPHSRFIVCDGSIDNVVGVVQAKDLLNRILDGADLSLTATLRHPMVVPDTVSALDALERLKLDPLGLAIVMDEYGSFEGVVTVADVLEAIVGDPTDTTPSASKGHAPEEDVLYLDGMMAVDEVKARLELPDLPAEGSYHTMAGLLLALLRRVPRSGDRIVFGGWRFEVQDMEGRRVAKVRVAREPLDAQEPV
jgi:putative hemolysin